MTANDERHGLRRLAASASINVAVSVMAAVAGLLATGIMARELPVDQFGRVLLLLTAVNAIAIFEGLRPVVIFRVAARVGDPSALFKAAYRVNTAMAGVALFCVAMAAWLIHLDQIGAIFWIAFAFTVAAFFVVVQYWSFLDAESDTVFTGIARGCNWILVYALFCALALLQAELSWFAAVMLVATLALAVALRWRFIRLGLNGRYVTGAASLPLSELLRSVANNIAFNVSAVTINVADRGVIAALMGAGPAGAYSGPSELALRAGGLVRAAMQVVLPWAARQSNEPGQRQRIWLVAMNFIGVAAASSTLPLILFRDQLAVLLLGTAFSEVGDLLGLFALGVIVSTVGYAAIAYLNARGDFNTQRRLYAWSAAALIVAATLAAYYGSLTLVATAFLLARSVDLVIAVKVLRECESADRRALIAMGIAYAAAVVAAWAGQAVLAALAGAAVLLGAAAHFRRWSRAQ
ncbi:MAG TPA: hypothetical protein PLS93_06205 [Accumulibacter sp.]|nr:hypothetical protein [Accumulibacter sp.]